jgi:hypothetical protein
MQHTGSGKIVAIGKDMAEMSYINPVILTEATHSPNFQIGVSRTHRIESWCNTLLSPQNEPNVFFHPIINEHMTSELYDKILIHPIDVIWNQLIMLTNTTSACKQKPPFPQKVFNRTLNICLPDNSDSCFVSVPDNNCPWTALSGSYVKIDSVGVPGFWDYCIVQILDGFGRSMHEMCIHIDILENFANRWFVFKAWIYTNTVVFAPKNMVDNLNGGSHCDKARAVNLTTIGKLRTWCYEYINTICKPNGDGDSMSLEHIAHGLCYSRWSTLMSSISDVLKLDPISEATHDLSAFMRTM